MVTLLTFDVDAPKLVTVIVQRVDVVFPSMGVIWPLPAFRTVITAPVPAEVP